MQRICNLTTDRQESYRTPALQELQEAHAQALEMMVPFKTLEPHSITWPLGESLVIPWFPHEAESMYLVALDAPPQELNLESAHLVWIRDDKRKQYRMVRLFKDGSKHGEDSDANGIPTGTFTCLCPCPWCCCVLPLAIPQESAAIKEDQETTTV